MTAASTSRPLRALVVDDDLVDRMGVVRALRKLGADFEVQEAESAQEALQKLRASPFDCVLSDLDMPGQDGAWLLEQIRAQGIDVPVIVLTGHGDEQVAVAMMKAGAVDYLPKATLSPQRLSQALQHGVRLHQAEREARRARERLELALEATGLGTWDIDLTTRELTWDARCQALYGTPGRTPPVERAMEVVHPEDREAVQASLQAVFAPASRGAHHSEHRVNLPDEERWVRVYGQVFYNDGRPARFVGTIQDITPLRAAEAVARRRLEFEQQLIGIVSHDLRNPISAMIMGARLLKDQALKELGPSSPLAAIAARVASSGDRATRLLRDLLDFTQARTGHGIPVQRQPMDLHQVCRQAVEELALNHPQRQIVCAPQGEGSGQWDPDRIGQVVGNLVRNALTYSPDDSTVTVRSEGGADRVCIEVHNHNRSGPIPEHVQASLFQPFRRGDVRHDPERSIGLGLFIVSQIVAAHGGTVLVRSTEADGTTFRVELPRAGA